MRCTNNFADIAAVLILAGGQSMRMQTPKALLNLPGGENLLQFHVRYIQKYMPNTPILIADAGKGFANTVCTDVINIAHKHHHSLTDKKVYAIDDFIAPIEIAPTLTAAPTTKGAGPLSAMAAAMYIVKQMHHTPPYLLVISIDCLLIAPVLYHMLKNKTANVHYLINQNKNGDIKHYPILGLYHSNLFKSLAQFLQSRYSVMQFLDLIDDVQITKIDAYFVPFLNINTPSDFLYVCNNYQKLIQYTNEYIKNNGLDDE